MGGVQEDASDDEGIAANDGKCVVPADPSTPQNFADPSFVPAAMTPLPDGDAERLRLNEEQRKEVSMLENMIQDHQTKYESTIRQHLQLMQRDAAEADNTKFPQLYANVRKWQDQLEPVLKEFASRPEFDIH